MAPMEGMTWVHQLRLVDMVWVRGKTILGRLALFPLLQRFASCDMG